jgi:hypothetical protein
MLTIKQLYARAKAREQWERDKCNPIRLARKQASAMAWRKANKEKHAIYNKAWREANPDQWRELKKVYRRKAQARALSNLRKRLRDEVPNRAINKEPSHSSLLGCTVKALCKHLEYQFINGMSWDNYGEWHIDHIIPCAYFDLNNKQQLKACFHYTNLQPLWAWENIAKGNDYTPPGNQYSTAVS